MHFFFELGASRLYTKLHVTIFKNNGDNTFIIVSSLCGHKSALLSVTALVVDFPVSVSHVEQGILILLEQFIACPVFGGGSFCPVFSCVCNLLLRRLLFIFSCCFFFFMVLSVCLLFLFFLVVFLSEIGKALTYLFSVVSFPRCLWNIWHWTFQGNK